MKTFTICCTQCDFSFIATQEHTNTPWDAGACGHIKSGQYVIKVPNSVKV